MPSSRAVRAPMLSCWSVSGYHVQLEGARAYARAIAARAMKCASDEGQLI